MPQHHPPDHLRRRILKTQAGQLLAVTEVDGQTIGIRVLNDFAEALDLALPARCASRGQTSTYTAPKRPDRAQRHRAPRRTATRSRRPGHRRTVRAAAAGPPDSDDGPAGPGARRHEVAP